jgi:hypothetical protein
MKHLKKNLIIGISLITTNICFADENIAANNIFDPKLVQVYAKAQHFLTINKQKKIRYNFSVVNQSASKVYMLTVGAISAVNDSPGIVLKSDDIFDVNAIAPKGWFIEDASRGEEPLASVVWRVPLQSLNLDYSIDYTSIMQPAKSTWSSFILETDKRYSSIYKTYAHIYLESSNNYSSTILKGDTTAPTANLAATLVKHPTKTGFYNVNLKVTAKDNYDPLPEIVFTSVTASGVSNSPFNAGAYTLNTPNNVTTGAYPSIITFAADANAAKQYKINYTVTDASDNKTDVSTTVTVPKR